MRFRPPTLLLLAVLITPIAAFWLLAQSKTSRGAQYAFLVACSGYDRTELRELPFTINDIEGFRDALVATGFDPENIKVLHDKCGQRRYLPEKAKILHELSLLLAGLREEDSLVMALSGHGVHFKGDKTGFFCPIDARLDDKTTLIPMEGSGGLFETLKSCKAKKKLLVVNACRNDPASDLAQAAKKVELDDEDSDQVPEGIAALYSCKAGQKSYFDSDRKRGIFFDHLIRAWKGEYRKEQQALDLEDVFHEVVRKTKADVDRTFSRSQVPEVRREYKGQWVIAARSVRPPGTADENGPGRPDDTQVEKTRPALLDCTPESGVGAAQMRRAQDAWARHLGRKVEEDAELGKGVKMTFVLIPPGKFRMGSPADEKDRDPQRETLHEVTLTQPFDLGKTEVTQEQYEALTANNSSKFKGADRPVETVNWQDAQDYAAALTKKRADNHVYRLPTEAEWEYACRAGRSSSAPFGVGSGRALSSRDANFDGTKPYGGADKGPDLQATCRVGSFAPNALGLLDMHGNVMEWCSDWQGPYPRGAVTNPTGPADGSMRIYRGGSWSTKGAGCRAAARQRTAPWFQDGDLGFRLARSIPVRSN
jgi:formylglycine-generating enzyme required for sulfatase activity